MPLTDAQRRRKINDMRRRRGLTDPRTCTPEQQQQVTKHVEHLRRHGASLETIAKAANLTTLPVFRVTHGLPITPKSYAAIMHITVEGLADESAMTAEDLLWHTRTLQAAGYTLVWQETNAGITPYVLRKAIVRASAGTSRTVEPATARRVRALHARYGHIMATPHATGMRARDITRARSQARELGYYPAAAYNDDRTLDLRSVPGHPFAATDEFAHRRIEGLRVVLANPDLAGGALATSLGIDDPAEHESEERYFDRILETLRLRTSHPWSIFARAILADALQRFDDGDGDPVRFCLDNHLVKWNSSGIARQHPALLAWQAERPARSRPGRELIATRKKMGEAAAA